MVQRLLVRVEQLGEVLGEWPVDNIPITMHLCDADTGRIVASVGLSAPTRPSLQERVPVDLLEEEPEEVTDHDAEGMTDRYPEVELQDAADGSPPEDFEEGDTVLAPMPDVLRPAVLRPPPEQGFGTSARGRYDEVPWEEEAASDEDDLSLPLVDEPESDDPDRLPDDDFTMPLPEGGGSDEDDLELLDLDAAETEERSREWSERSENTTSRQRVRTSTDSAPRHITGALPPFMEVAEVWFRQAGKWIPRGTLAARQHVQALGGLVRCDDRGGLDVIPGVRLSGSATLPSGDLVPVSAGQDVVHFPPGTCVILWSGDLGFYVRSNLVQDAEPSSSDGLVEYERTPNPLAYRPPRSDLEDSGL